MRHPSRSRSPSSRSALPPLDPAALDRLALRYVERFATSRGKLADYLTRKIRERGWAEATPPDPRAVAELMAGLGYVDDRAFAEARARAMARRGLGARRVGQALNAAGIEAEDSEALAPEIEERAGESALAFARRRRIGPWATAPADPAVRRKQLAALLRAGHDLALSKRIVAMAPGETIDDFHQA